MKTEPYREAPYLRRAYVLGHPIAHSLSPALHRAAYDFLGEQNLGYDRRDTLPDDLPAIMHGVRHPKGTEDAPYIAGLSVTMPLKTAVIKYCDELSETARVTGAVPRLNSLDAEASLRPSTRSLRGVVGPGRNAGYWNPVGSGAVVGTVAPVGYAGPRRSLNVGVGYLGDGTFPGY